MILRYRDKRTRDFAAGKRVKAFSGIERSVQLKLDRLEAAASLKDLAALPGNRFEALRGHRKGQYSIRINDHGGSVSSGQTFSRSGQCRNRGLSLGRDTWHASQFLLASISPKN